jgi:hypothetical protein
LHGAMTDYEGLLLDFGGVCGRSPSFGVSDQRSSGR